MKELTRNPIIKQVKPKEDKVQRITFLDGSGEMQIRRLPIELDWAAIDRYIRRNFK